MPRALRTYVRIVDRISDIVGAAAMYLVFVIIAVLLLDAITSETGLFLHWCVEFAQFTLAAYFFMGGARTVKDGDHVRMDLLYERLSQRGKCWVDAVTLSCLAFYLTIMLIGGVSSLEYAIATDERRFSMWNPSMVPIKALMVACLALMLAQTLSEFIKHAAVLCGAPLDADRKEPAL